MTPTLSGRIQSRLFVVLVVGGLWSFVIALFLTRGGSYINTYWVLFQVLLWVAGLGILWELLYHWRQQYRWEKDWPILYGFITFINEGILAFIIVGTLGLVAIPGGTMGVADAQAALDQAAADADAALGEAADAAAAAGAGGDIVDQAGAAADDALAQAQAAIDEAGSNAGVPLGDFLLHFLTTWVIGWIWINGPHRIFFIRWRFEGGRFV